MPATLATAANLAKEVYLGTIREELQNETVATKRIESTSQGVTSEVGGKYVTFPLRVRRNSGIGHRQEMEALPQSGQQGYAQVRIPLKYGYGRVRLTGQVFELINSNFQAFASAMDQEMTGLQTDLAKDANRVVYGDGSGTLGVVVSNAANVVTVNNAQYFNIGDFIDTLAVGSTTAANATLRSAALTGVYVAAISLTNNTITLSTSPTAVVAPTMTGLVAGDFFTRSGSYFREANGFTGIVNNAAGLMQNLDGSVEPTWNAVVDSNGGTTRALSETMMIKNTDSVRRNGGKVSVLLASLGVRRSYFNLLTQQRRFPSTTTFAGGLEGLEFHNGRSIPFVEDVDCPANTIFGLQESSFKIYRNEPWNWMDRDGSMWKQVIDTISSSGPGNVGRFDAYEAVLHQYYEFATDRRNGNFVMKDLIES